MAKIELIAVHGNEDSIVLAARQSYNSTEIKNKEKLISYLMKHGHGVPFEYVDVVFRITAPIFVARHFYTYRTWTRSEQSLRYVEPQDMEFYYPDPEEPDSVMEEAYATAVRTYFELRKKGMRKEDARAVLPLGLHTTFMVKIDLRNFAHFLEQRLATDTQDITRRFAAAMFWQVYKALPIWGQEFFIQHKELFTHVSKPE